MSCSKWTLQKIHLVKFMEIIHLSLTEAKQLVLFYDH